MQRLGGGHFIDELHAALLRVSDEVALTGKNGAVSVTFKVQKPKGNSATITIEESIRLTLPTQGGMGALFFIHESQFHGRDPRQTEMQMRSVEEEEGTAKKPKSEVKTRKAVE